MNNNQEQINFTVNIELNNNEAIFSYSRGGKPATGGGIVRTETAGIYSLDKVAIEQGFVFTGATITNKVGACAEDFSYKLSDNRQAITITDTAKNFGTVCLIFNVECNGKAYESADPQVENDDIL
ncbi:DP-EP family protein [Pseudoalteromonas sp. Z1A8]|uniref:DP-EP family protein n=1 Tax=Pseudoalteromonas sp. Z1A8 TaxID=2686354 RepID=UPI00140CBA60|nr:DP-EP family protein [Pseudoalteromonas sp. Z1A8]